LLTLLASGAGLLQPLVAQRALEALDASDELRGTVVLLAALLIGATAVSGFNAWLQQRTAERVVRQVRKRLCYRLIRLEVPELDRRRPGDLISRVTSDSTLLQNAVSGGAIMLVNGSLTLAAALVLMFTVHAGLLAATVCVLLTVAGALLYVLPRIRQAVTRAQFAIGEVGATLDRTLGAIRTVKSNGGELRETAAADAAIERAYQAGLTGGRYSAVVSVLAGLSVQTTFLVVLGFGGFLVTTGRLSVPALIAFLLYTFYLSSPLSSLANGLRIVQEGLGAIVRINEVDRMTTEEDIGRVETTTGTAPPRIDVRGLSFSYVGRPPALRDVTFSAPAGGRTALVGLSGAGKSTLFALLQRFYEPDGGSIKVDGRDLTTLTRGEVRQLIAYVEQEATMIEGTLGENLCYGEPTARRDEIDRVLRDTRLDELVAKLDRGLETPVGPRGVSLSGSERQRLAIARALLRRPRVLLLDEATAQLDGRNELVLRDVIDHISPRCTVLMIAHRLSTVAGSVQILVLENGSIRARGSHTALLTADALYRELATTQLLTNAGERRAHSDQRHRSPVGVE